MGELAYMPYGVDNTGEGSHRIGWNSTIAHCNIVFIYMFRGGNQICPRYGSAHEQLNIARLSLSSYGFKNMQVVELTRRDPIVLIVPQIGV